MPDVRIVDLEIIKRFSLAVRTEFADADDVLEALEASLDEVRAAADGGRKKRRAPKKRASRAKTAKKGGSRKSTAKKTKSSRSGAEK